MKHDKVYVTHILECIQRIESYTHDGLDIFLNTPMAQDAAIRNFEVIGEAAKRVSPELKQAHPDVPWRRIDAFRDVLIHDYMGVDLNEVWNIAERELPDLKRKIETILRGMEVSE